MTDHKAQAELALADYPNLHPDDGGDYLLFAQVHATLHLADQMAALVEQQRVGNLIAFATDSENALDTRNGAAIRARKMLGL